MFYGFYNNTVSHTKQEAALGVLSETKLTKRRGSSSSTDEPEVLIKRHAAVLALSSVILAFPYEIPEWMPKTLVVLSSCTSDRAPIGPEVSKTFAEFRRTHQDTWHEDKEKLTEDELYELSDLLISPSYYA